MRQVAKRMECSKAKAKYMKQVASDPQTAQINLLCHQHTELPPSKFQKKQKKSSKFRQNINKQQYYNEEKTKKTTSGTRNMKHMQDQIDKRSVVLDVQLVGTHAEVVTNMVISVACAIRRKKHLTRKGLWSPDHPKYINFRLVQFICKIPYEASQMKVQVMIHSACKYNCNLDKLRPGYQHHNILLQI